jgi:preprotein translocase subunit SecE
MNETAREQGAERGSSAGLWLAIALVVAGIAGYYLLSAQAGWLRWLAVAAGIVAAALVFGLSSGGKGFQRFLVDARNELRKVFWPGRQETWMTTLVVFVFASVAGLFFWLLDLFLAWIVKLLTGQGG